MTRGGAGEHSAGAGGPAAGETSVAGAGGAAAGAFGLGGALNQAGTSAAGAAGIGGNAGATSASGGAGGGAGHGAGGQVGAAGASGNAGKGGAAGAVGAGNGLYCAPCVASADCAAGAYCVGGLNPRCGKACSLDADCSVGTATSTCDFISIGGGLTPGGGGAASPVGTATQPFAGVGLRSCTPSDAVCGTGKTSAMLDCSDSWDSYGSGFFANTCIGTCHRHDTTFTTVAAVRTQADAIRLEVDSGAMPQDRTLPEAERLRLLTWLACGAP